MSMPPFFATWRTERRARCRYSHAGPWIGGSICAGRTRPICHKASSSARCLAATCAAASKCCSEQPPQTPKCGHRGCTRAALGLAIVSARAISYVGLRFSVVIATTSPGNAPSTKTALPSMRAIAAPFLVERPDRHDSSAAA